MKPARIISVKWGERNTLLVTICSDLRSLLQFTGNIFEWVFRENSFPSVPLIPKQGEKDHEKSRTVQYQMVRTIFGRSSTGIQRPYQLFIRESSEDRLPDRADWRRILYRAEFDPRVGRPHRQDQRSRRH